MLSAMLAIQAGNKAQPFPLLDLPTELVERVVSTLGPKDQAAKKAARASCTHLRSAVNAAVTTVKIGSDMEGHTLPAALLPRLQSITLNVSNGKQPGVWSADNLASLGIHLAPQACTLAIEADAAIVHLRQLHQILTRAGLLGRVRSLNQQCWGIQGEAAHFGMDIEVSAKLKLVRVELIEPLVRNTLRHDNLVSLCFAPMLKNAWSLSLIREINASAASTLRSLAVNFRPFQEVDLLPLAEADLSRLEHLELRVQSEHGFGAAQLQPLSQAKLPNLRRLVIEMTGSSRIVHLGEFLRPLVGFRSLESIEVWANHIDNFAGLWGVGKGGVFLPQLSRLALRVSSRPAHAPPCCFATNPLDRVVDAFAGLTLDRLELHDIGLPEGACASGIKQLALTNPRWDDLRIAMSPTFSPDLQVIRVCGSTARAMRTRMLDTLMEAPVAEPGWRIGSPTVAASMHKARSFVVLHDLEGAKSI